MKISAFLGSWKLL